MRFVADESVDHQIIDRLRQDGHQVWAVAEMESGISDDTVLGLASSEEALLLTADKDFGELVFRQRRVASGILLLRLFGLSQTRKSEIVSAAIREHTTELPTAFTVITPGLTRIRRQAL